MGEACSTNGTHDKHVQNVLSYKHNTGHDMRPRRRGQNNTVRSESRCALRLRYVDLVVSIEVAVAVCCCFTVFSCQTAVEVQYQ
jgi:hypothetical protein